MDPKRPLFIATVLFIVFAGVWILAQVVPQLAIVFVLGLLAALAGFIMLLLWQRHLTGTDRRLALTGSAVAVAWFVAVLVLALLANPITFKGEPGESTALNEDPPAFLDAAAQTLTNLLPLVVVAASVVALWPAWSMRERSLGVVAAVLLALVTVPPLLGTGIQGMMANILFGVALIAWLAALVLPLAMPRDAESERVEAHGTG